MSVVEQQAGLTDLIPCTPECGGQYDEYSFSQTDSELIVVVPLPQGTTSKALDVRIATNSLLISLKGAKPILEGPLFKPIKASESSWLIEERKTLVLTLTKANLQYEEWWPHVVTSARQIDMKMLKPPSKHVRDLDSAAQATVAKMMFDQDQKRKGLPTSDEIQFQNMLQH